MHKPTDSEILAVMRGYSSSMTYVIANRLRREFQREIETSFVLRRLKAMEKTGKVKRVPSVFAVQIGWAEAASNENSQRGSEA